MEPADRFADFVDNPVSTMLHPFCRITVLSVGLSSLLFPFARAEAYDVLAKPCAEGALSCASGVIAFEHTDALPVQWSFDTGWVPQNSPLSVHLTAGVYASTHVALEGALEARYPEALSLTVLDRSGAGTFDFHYGAEFAAEGKIAITLAGKTFGWTGDIPYVPQFDFQVKAATPFEPWAFSPGVTLVSTTTPATIADVGIGDIVGSSIPGIDGGFALDVAVDLAATYVTDRIVFAGEDGAMVSGGPISSADEASSMSYLGGPSVELDVHPEGAVTYMGTVHMIPAFFVKLLGKSFQIPIADIPLAFPITERAWSFEPQRVHVPLPDLKPDETLLDFGEVELGDTRSGSVLLANKGEARVFAALTSSSPEVFVSEQQSVWIETGEKNEIVLHFVPRAPGAFMEKLLITSNDPDEPMQVIELKARAVRSRLSFPNPPQPEAPAKKDALDQDTGCACRAAGQGQHRSAGALSLVALTLSVLGRRRLRHRSHSATKRREALNVF